MKDDDSIPGAPDWMVTYGDMMSLLLTFFIMLVSMSQVKEDALYQAVADSIRRRFGYHQPVVTNTPGAGTSQVPGRVKKVTSGGEALNRDAPKGQAPNSAPAGDPSRITGSRTGFEPAVGCVVFFQEGRHELTEEGKATLDAWVARVAGKPQKMEVRGHTSKISVPFESPYADNWELAHGRARSVLEYLVHLRLDERRARISSAADHEPLYTGANLEEVERNNRVEIFLLDEIAEDFQGRK
jgi:chemotaxis protein MotB